ncbi:TPA: putative addiction module antidote protein [Candidatus Sumerlaeota bacterium]|jgi:probable addiction module antidote protein|nr:putative addiction module antidote protein [Candidatus Sumerlaeota bacterium]
MEKIKTRPFDPARYLETEEDMAVYLTAALQEDDPALVGVVLGDIIRAYGMTQVAKLTGLSRTSLYKAFSADGNPSMGTVLKVIHALGISLSAARVPEAPAVSKTARKKPPKRVPASVPARATV